MKSTSNNEYSISHDLIDIAPKDNDNYKLINQITQCNHCHNDNGNYLHGLCGNCRQNYILIKAVCYISAALLYGIIAASLSAQRIILGAIPTLIIVALLLITAHFIPIKAFKFDKESKLQTYHKNKDFFTVQKIETNKCKRSYCLDSSSQECKTNLSVLFNRTSNVQPHEMKLNVSDNGCSVIFDNRIVGHILKEEERAFKNEELSYVIDNYEIIQLDSSDYLVIIDVVFAL